MNDTSLSFLFVHRVGASPAVVKVAVASAGEIAFREVDLLSAPIAEQAPAIRGLAIAQDSSFRLGTIEQSMVPTAFLRACWHPTLIDRLCR